jgi:hypothetical protein
MFLINFASTLADKVLSRRAQTLELPGSSKHFFGPLPGCLSFVS